MKPSHKLQDYYTLNLVKSMSTTSALKDQLKVPQLSGTPTRLTADPTKAALVSRNEKEMARFLSDSEWP